MGEVKTKLTIVDNATSKLNKINKALDLMNTRMNNLAIQSRAVGNSLGVFSSNAQPLISNLNNVAKSSDRVANGTRKYAESTKIASDGTSLLITKLRRLASAYLGVMGAKAMITSADTMTMGNNKFVTYGMNQGMDATAAQAFSKETQQKIFGAAQRSASGYGDMMTNVAKSLTLAGKAFDGNADKAIRFQEVMAKSYALGGASAAEQASSMYQLVQALGSGKLQGDELRSVREGAPLAAQQIEKFAQKLFNTNESLKDLASEGYITSELVVAAITEMGDNVDKQFEQIDMTFSQLWTMFKNDALNAITPFLEKLREIANSPAVEVISEKLINGLYNLGAVLTWVGNIAQIIIDWMADHWEYVEVGLWAIAALISYVFGQHLVTVVTKAIDAFKTFATTNSTFLIILLTISAIAIAIRYLGDQTTLTAQQIGVALMFVGAVMLIIRIIAKKTGAAMLTAFTSPIIMWVALLVLAVGAFMKFGDIIVGVVFAAGAIIWNIIAGVINGIIQFIWSIFVEPFIGIIEWVLNVCNGGFNSFGDAVANLIGQIISWFLSLGKVVTKIIDAIFGTDWTSGLSGLQDEVVKWGKNEKAITLNVNAPELGRLDVGNAYNTGTKVGSAIQDKLSDWTKGISTKLGFDKNDSKYQLDESAFSQPDYDELLDNTAYTADNTNKMAKSMELTAEDLKYLRLLAERESINKFTTAEVKVVMTNNNNMNNMGDLDGIVTQLSTKLREELQVVADGVHI